MLLCPTMPLWSQRRALRGVNAAVGDGNHAVGRRVKPRVARLLHMRSGSASDPVTAGAVWPVVAARRRPALERTRPRPRRRRRSASRRAPGPPAAQPRSRPGERKSAGLNVVGRGGQRARHDHAVNGNEGREQQIGRDPEAPEETRAVISPAARSQQDRGRTYTHDAARGVQADSAPRLAPRVTLPLTLPRPLNPSLSTGSQHHEPPYVPQKRYVGEVGERPRGNLPVSGPGSCACVTPAGAGRSPRNCPFWKEIRACDAGGAAASWQPSRRGQNVTPPRMCTECDASPPAADAVLRLSLDPHVEAPVHPSSVTRSTAPGGPSPPTPPRVRRSRAPAARSRHLTLGHRRRQIPTARWAVPRPSWRRQTVTVTSRGASIVRCRRIGPSQWQRIGQLAIIARCHRVSRRSSKATVRVAAADAKRTSEANTRSIRLTQTTESPREMSGWFWSAADASGFTSEGTSGSLNGRASRHRTGPRRSGANVRPGSRRLKRPNVISVCSWTKCTRRWTTIFVFSPPSPCGRFLIAHHSGVALIPRLGSTKS